MRVVRRKWKVRLREYGEGKHAGVNLACRWCAEMILGVHGSWYTSTVVILIAFFTTAIIIIIIIIKSSILTLIVAFCHLLLCFRATVSSSLCLFGFLDPSSILSSF